MKQEEIKKVLQKAEELAREETAEKFAKIIRGNLSKIDDEVQKKFEELYAGITRRKMYGGYKD